MSAPKMAPYKLPTYADGGINLEVVLRARCGGNLAPEWNQMQAVATNNEEHTLSLALSCNSQFSMSNRQNGRFSCQDELVCRFATFLSSHNTKRNDIAVCISRTIFQIFVPMITDP